MTVNSMLDVTISGHTFRLTRVEAGRLRDLLDKALGDRPAWPTMDAWPPVPLPATGPLPPSGGQYIYCGKSDG